MKNLDHDVKRAVTLLQLQQVLLRAASDGDDSQDPDFFIKLLFESLTDNNLPRFQLVLDHTPSDFKIFTHALSMGLAKPEHQDFLQAVIHWHLGNPQSKADPDLILQTAVECVLKFPSPFLILEQLSSMPGAGNLMYDLTKELAQEWHFRAEHIDPQTWERIYRHDAFLDAVMEMSGANTEEEAVQALADPKVSKEFLDTPVAIFLRRAQRNILERQVGDAGGRSKERKI